MTEPINVCHGFGCPKMLHCAISDYNFYRDGAGWVRHFQSSHVGEDCENFRPLRRAPKWGEGKDEDND